MCKKFRKNYTNKKSSKIKNSEIYIINHMKEISGEVSKESINQYKTLSALDKAD